MTEKLKDYLEQEGISADDILNAEIEQEHKEADRNNHKTGINFNELKKVVSENLCSKAKLTRL